MSRRVAREQARRRYLPHVEPLEDRRLLAVAAMSINKNQTGTGDTGSAFSNQSADGRYVVFTGFATNLVSGIEDANGSGPDIFRRDRVAGKTELVSKSISGAKTANNSSGNPMISANGKYVLFESAATDLVTNDINNQVDVFVRNMETGITKLVSINIHGTTTQNALSTISDSSQVDGRFISDDGHFVVFQSEANDLVADDDNQNPDVFVRDVWNNKTFLVNRGNGQVGQDPSRHGVISADGRYVAFESMSRNIVSGDQNFNLKIFRRDLKQNITQLVTKGDQLSPFLTTGGSFNPQISADGNMIAFLTDRVFSNVDNANYQDVYVRDMTKSVPELVSIGLNNQAADYSSFDQTISDDGRHVAFESIAGNLAAKDQDTGNNLNAKDVFVRHLVDKTTELVSVKSDNSRDANKESRNIAISGNGRYVTWESQATDLVANFVDNDDPTFDYDIYYRDLSTDKTTFLSAKVNTTAQSSSHGGHYPIISRDGRSVTFHSTSVDLISNDLNGQQTDVFAWPKTYSAPQFSGVVTSSGGSTVVKEGGQTDTYTIALTAKPNSNVTVTVHQGSQLNVSKTTLTFTPLNWYVSQTITVTAKDDALAQGNRNVTITHTTTSADAHYNNKTLPSLSVTIQDNDSAGIPASAAQTIAPAVIDDLLMAWSSEQQRKRK